MPTGLQLYIFLHHAQILTEGVHTQPVLRLMGEKKKKKARIYIYCGLNGFKFCCFEWQA